MPQASARRNRVRPAEKAGDARRDSPAMRRAKSLSWRNSRLVVRKPKPKSAKGTISASSTNGDVRLNATSARAGTRIAASWKRASKISTAATSQMQQTASFDSGLSAFSMRRPPAIAWRRRRTAPPTRRGREAPCRSSDAAVGPSARMPPSPTTMERAQSLSARSMSWVISATVRPLSRNARISAARCAAPCASRPAIGSSSTRSGQRSAMVSEASASLRFWPCESSNG